MLVCAACAKRACPKQGVVCTCTLIHETIAVAEMNRFSSRVSAFASEVHHLRVDVKEFINCTPDPAT